MRSRRTDVGRRKRKDWRLNTLRLDLNDLRALDDCYQERKSPPDMI